MVAVQPLSPPSIGRFSLPCSSEPQKVRLNQYMRLSDISRCVKVVVTRLSYCWGWVLDLEEDI